MKPVLRASLICEDFATKSDGGLVIIGAFWSIRAFKVPSVYGPILLMNLWTRGEGEFTEETQFLLRNNETVFAKVGPSPLKFNSVDQLVPSIFQVSLPLKEFGTNWVRVLLDREVVLEYPLSIVPIEIPRQKVKEGDLVQGFGPGVYLVEKSKRRLIPDPETFESMSFNWEAIKRLPAEQLLEIPEGRPLRRRRVQLPLIG